ncbi:MAG: hypothetical protein JRF27_05620 [Deltaproteobacteria bacterium]|nr:hypothetical protein [Deltaproteobacteria bacterium]
MRSKSKILIAVLFAAIFLIGGATANAADTGLVSSLDLTKDQVAKLGTFVEEFNAKALDIATKVDTNFRELEQELKKKDRFDTRMKAWNGAQNSNKLVKNISSLYGDLLKLRVEYLLKSKDILTERQKAVLLGAMMDFDMDMPGDFFVFLGLDFTDMGLDLTKDQVKKILKYRADMEINDIKLDLEMDYKLLDLQDEINSMVRDTKKINKIVMDITNIGVKIMNNRVNQTLKAKDVLTVEQKKEVLHMLMMM